MFDGKVSPSIVGYDIACGNKAVRLDMDGDEARKNIKTIMDDVWKSIEFGIGRKNQEVVDHELFDSDAWRFGVASDFKDKAREQLGTVGSGTTMWIFSLTKRTEFGLAFTLEAVDLDILWQATSLSWVVEATVCM